MSFLFRFDKQPIDGWGISMRLGAIAQKMLARRYHQATDRFDARPIFGGDSQVLVCFPLELDPWARKQTNSRRRGTIDYQLRSHKSLFTSQSE
jgi:hypothetical protein